MSTTVDGGAHAAGILPLAAPIHGQQAAVAETHSATVVFLGDRAYKIKKPVDLGFLDFSTPEARRIACEREVELNRRLAPDVYLGVSKVIGPDDKTCEHLVAMRRMPASRRLSACLDRSEQVGPALADIARQLAELHSHDSTPELTDAASEASVRNLWVSGFHQVVPHLGMALDAGTERTIEHLALRYLDGRGPLFDARIADGQVRDGHGDLQAEDIFLLDDGPRILDCLEFDDHLRWGDVLMDVAFLAMDLERLGHPRLARLFLAEYRAASGRSWPDSLAHHYIAYRAHVRAKVGAIRAQQTGHVSFDVEALHQQCLRHLRAGGVRLVLIGGSPGTGKSTLAAALGDATGARVLRTDEVRRQLPDHEDRYSPAAIDATYQWMSADAERLLARGHQVILDATWSHSSHRDLARLAADRVSADLIEIRCVAPLEVSRARVARRAAEGTDASEATEEVATTIAERFERWPQAVCIATDRPVGSALADARAACDWEHPFDAI